MRQIVRFNDGYYEFLQDNDVVYDFECDSPARALRWIEHMAQKSWVTKLHLQQFASLFAAQIGEGY